MGTFGKCTHFLIYYIAKLQKAGALLSMLLEPIMTPSVLVLPYTPPPLTEAGRTWLIILDSTPYDGKLNRGVEALSGNSNFLIIIKENLTPVYF